MQGGFELALITGSTGWLGKSFVRILATGRLEQNLPKDFPVPVRLRCLVQPGEDGAALRAMSPRIEVVEGDLRNLADCRRFVNGARGAYLFHTAGVIHPARVRDFYHTNVDGVRNLLEEAESQGVRRVVAISSNSPIGCNPRRDRLFDEASPYHPYMNYGRSKMMMELAVREIESRGKLETVIIRAPWFYGPNQPPRQTQFFSMIRQGKIPIVGSGSNLRSLAYVDNLCQGMLLAALTKAARGQVYWIADRRPYSMNEIIDTVERLLGEEFHLPVTYRRVRLPEVVGEVAWLADKMIQTGGYYHSKIHVLSELNKTIACSVQKAQNELGYRPNVNLEEGMRRSIAWCVENRILI
ncbi:MAG: NAD(P)-dependent oxidoreductase [Verrucomicrobia bacterium]|nr:NAD(P)-dependent oxidoreductase [Verrucomicrobiota bacterium]MBV8485336.1 NAD(P)-dependent oxidoreductase [Verrucomicrobiota bacterium]